MIAMSKYIFSDYTKPFNGHEKEFPYINIEKYTPVKDENKKHMYNRELISWQEEAVNGTRNY